MKILIYFSQMSLGGGSRLFSHLIPAISLHSDIEAVSVLTHDQSIVKLLIELQKSNVPIDIKFIPIPFWLNWLTSGKRMALDQPDLVVKKVSE